MSSPPSSVLPGSTGAGHPESELKKKSDEVAKIREAMEAHPGYIKESWAAKKDEDVAFVGIEDFFDKIRKEIQGDKELDQKQKQENLKLLEDCRLQVVKHSQLNMLLTSSSAADVGAEAGTSIGAAAFAPVVTLATTELELAPLAAVGVATGAAIGTFVVAGAACALLYAGGRYIYAKCTGED